MRCLAPGKLRETALFNSHMWIIISQNKLIIFAESQSAASPSVFVMKNGTNVACLVKEFYPKDVTISLQSSKKIIEYEPAIVVSPEGKYSAVKLGQYSDPDSVTCSVEHNKKTWHSSDFEPKKDISGRSYLASRGWGCGEEKLREREVGDVNS